MYMQRICMEKAMRIALITGVLVLAFATASLADTRVTYSRHNADYSYDYGLSFGNPFYDPFTLGSANDRGGYRAFIPRGLQGSQDYYISSGYRGGRPGRTGGYSRGGYYRNGRSNNHNHYGHRNGGYTILQGQPYWNGYGYSYGYGSPTYIYPGRSAIVIDPNGSDYMQPQGDVYNDNRVYDNDIYDNSRTVNNYDVPALPKRAEPLRPQVGPVQPRVDPIVPAQPQIKSSGMRFGSKGRIVTPEGARVYKVEKGVLYTQLEGGSLVKIAEGVDADFGGYAVIQPIGSAVIFRQGNRFAAAYQTEKDGWWVEQLNYNIDFSRRPSFSMMGGEPWVTFTATDGTRWVVKLSGHQWIEVGSGTR
jgi:hypothetical protein